MYLEYYNDNTKKIIINKYTTKKLCKTNLPNTQRLCKKGEDLPFVKLAQYRLIMGAPIWY